MARTAEKPAPSNYLLSYSLMGFTAAYIIASLATLIDEASDSIDVINATIVTGILVALVVCAGAAFFTLRAIRPKIAA